VRRGITKLTIWVGTPFHLQECPAHFLSATLTAEAVLAAKHPAYLLLDDLEPDVIDSPELAPYKTLPNDDLFSSQASTDIADSKSSDTEDSLQYHHDCVFGSFRPPTDQLAYHDPHHMPSFQDFHRAQPVRTPSYEPSLDELLGSDASLYDMWSRRSSIGLQSGAIRRMYESDPDMKPIRSRRNSRSSSTDSTSGSQIASHQVSRPSSAYVRTPAKQESNSPRATLVKRSSTASSTSSAEGAKRHSLLRRLSKGSSKGNSDREMLDFDYSRTQNRDVEIKKRKTLDDYDDVDDEMLL
jgi:hypothetical protein